MCFATSNTPNSPYSLGMAELLLELVPSQIHIAVSFVFNSRYADTIWSLDIWIWFGSRFVEARFWFLKSVPTAWFKYSSGERASAKGFPFHLSVSWYCAVVCCNLMSLYTRQESFPCIYVRRWFHINTSRLKFMLVQILLMPGLLLRSYTNTIYLVVFCVPSIFSLNLRLITYIRRKLLFRAYRLNFPGVLMLAWLYGFVQGLTLYYWFDDHFGFGS